MCKFVTSSPGECVPTGSVYNSQHPCPSSPLDPIHMVTPALGKGGPWCLVEGFLSPDPLPGSS